MASLTRAFVFVNVLFWGTLHLQRAVNIGIMINSDSTCVTASPLMCAKVCDSHPGEMNVTWRIHPNTPFAAIKAVQNIQDDILIHVSSSHQHRPEMADTSAACNLCPLTCSEFFKKYRYVFINTVCISPGARQCYLDNMAINRKYMSTYADVISLFLNRQDWRTYIIIASSQEVLTDLSITLVFSSYLLVTFDEKNWEGDISDIFSLFEEEDLNFVVVCSSTCINKLLFQAQFLESGLKKHSHWLVVPSWGNAREILLGSVLIKTTDVVIVETLSFSRFYTLNGKTDFMDDIFSLHPRNFTELASVLEHITLVKKGTYPHRLQNNAEKVWKTNDASVHAQIYVFHQSQNHTSVVSGGYIDGDENIVLTGELFPGRKYGLNNRILTVTLLKWEPFVYKKVENGLVSYSGICMDLLTELGHRLNFSYVLVEPEDQEFGRLVNGTWTGMVDMILKKKADVLLGPIIADAVRAEALDFTTPYFVDNSAVVLRRQDMNSNKWMTLVAPFHYEVYICIFVSFVLSSVFLFVLEEVNPLNKWESNRPSDKWSRYCVILWYHFGALMANVGSYVPKTQTGRSILSCWWLFTVMSAAIYSGNLIAFLTDLREEPPFTTLAEMVEQDTYKWGTLGGSYYINIFQNSNQSEYKKIWKGIVAELTEDPDVLSIDSDVHLRKLLAGHYAYIGDLTILQMWEKEHCELLLLREVFSVIYLAIGLPHNSTLTEDFSKQILKIRESGLVDLWFKHWMPRKQCEVQRSAKRVELLALQSAFLAAGCGVLLALAVLIVEFVYSITRNIG